MKILSLILLIGCIFSIGQSFTLVCAEGHSSIRNSSSQAKCVPDAQIIDNCLIYNAADETKCSECRGGAVLDGTTPNINSCDCSGKTVMAQDNANDKVCVAGIENCSVYKATDLTKCFACHWGAVTTGGANDYSACDCSAKTNVVKDESGVSHCVANLIPNCDQYHQADATKCNVCRSGSTPDAAAGSIATCDCTGLDFTDGVDENGVGICATQAIENCLKYSSADTSKCHTCIPGAIPDVNSPATTVCACQSPNILQVDEQGNSICVLENDIIPDCKAYNSSQLSLCQACAEGYEADSGQSAPHIRTCVCASGTTPKLDENSERVCVPQAIDNCEFYANSDPSKCHTCITGYVETGGSAGLRESCLCTGGNVEKLDENGENVCVTTAVDDCDVYSSEHANKCHSCLPGFTPVGTSPQITECTCDSSTHTKTVDGDGNAVCVLTNALIDNCIAYNKDDLTKCHTCIQGVTLTGSSPNITECGCASPKQIKPTETEGVNVCVTIIEGCTEYSSSQITQCHICRDDFNKNDGNTECNCRDNGRVYAVDENGLEICGADIANCESLNSGNKEQCYECTAPFQGNGSSNDHTECACSEAGQISVTDETGAKHCAAEIKFCDIYQSDDRTKCNSCEDNTDKSSDSTSCDCNRIVLNENDEEICGPYKIYNCAKYNSAALDRCHTCIDGIDTGSNTLNTQCPCSQVGVLQDEREFCPSTPIENCNIYVDANNCHECGNNYNLESGQCTCAAENQVNSTNFETMCVENVIEYCTMYNALSYVCEQCKQTHNLKSDGSECVGDYLDDTSGGSLISFSFVILALLVLVA